MLLIDGLVTFDEIESLVLLTRGWTWRSETEALWFFTRAKSGLPMLVVRLLTLAVGVRGTASPSTDLKSSQEDMRKSSLETKEARCRRGRTN